MTANARAGSTGTNDENKQQSFFVHYLDLSAQDGLTALAGGAQAGTSLADFAMNKFSTVTTTGDSAQLPKAKQGRIRLVKNGSANSMNVFPQTGEAINAIAADGAYAVAAAKVVMFACFTDGTWDTLLTA